VRAGVLPHAVHVPKEIAERGLKVAQTVQLASTKSAGDAAFNADAPAAYVYQLETRTRACSAPSLRRRVLIVSVPGRSKEGAVRGSKKPDFVAPLGGLGEEGLVRARPAPATGDSSPSPRTWRQRLFRSCVRLAVLA
jgi:hypothetical protein